MSIDFSSQEFSVNSSNVPYNIATTGQNKKDRLCSEPEKFYQRWSIKNHIDDGRRPEAAVNEGNELKHSRLFVHPLGGIRDTMALVPSSHGTIYKSYALWKYVHRNEEKLQFITVKYVNDPPKGADDDRTDWTMKTTTRDQGCWVALSWSMQIQWCV